MNFLSILKPGIPKRGLLFIAASVWGFVSFRLLSIGVANILENTPLWWAYVAGGMVLSFPFFRFFFLGISEKHIKRMLGIKSPRPCLFSFFDVKGYIIMVFMISLGIFSQRIKAIPAFYLGTFYTSLGLALLFSALNFLFSGIRYKQIGMLG
mgnify:FL=1